MSKLPSPGICGRKAKCQYVGRRAMSEGMEGWQEVSTWGLHVGSPCSTAAAADMSLLCAHDLHVKRRTTEERTQLTRYNASRSFDIKVWHPLYSKKMGTPLNPKSLEIFCPPEDTVPSRTRSAQCRKPNPSSCATGGTSSSAQQSGMADTCRSPVFFVASKIQSALLFGPTFTK
ncbi:hypothetical protein BC835DRAFT_728714 [Cytidiella melzeri]|nr:hypothetical protein BC835DRAFT_728714 [Cytidiella melzeri]